MPFYYQINSKNSHGRRTARRLLELREALSAQVPKRTYNDTLLLASWNIREFDSDAYGERQSEAFFYIAEIISHFDLVAVQEVREDLKALEKVRKILGRDNWDYVVTDVTEGSPGNRERLAFLYDKRKVRFAGVAGELLIPPKEIKAKGKKTVYEASNQLYRTPFVVGFQAGWFKFLLTTVHMIYGKDKADDPKRVEEIRLVADFLKERAESGRSWSRNLILLGDFNIFGRDDTTMDQLKNAGFNVPEVLQNVPATNVGKKKRHYDQIAFQIADQRLTYLNGGVFDFYNHVFTADDEKKYAKAMGERYHISAKGKSRTDSQKSTYYKTYWRTHQMSDHLVMWIELGIDFGMEYLEAKTKAP